MKSKFLGEVRKLWSHRMLAVSISGPIFIVGYLLISSYPPTFVAESLVLVEPPRRVIADQTPVIEPKPVDAILIQTSQAIITSANFFERVVIKLGLQLDPRFVNTGKQRALLTAAEQGMNRALDWWDSIGDTVGLPPVGPRGRVRLAPPADRIDRPLPTEAERLAVAVERLQRSVSVSQIGRSTVISIRASALNAELGARIANALANQYVADGKDEQIAAARNASSTIKSRLDELQADLLRSQRAVADYKAGVGMGELMSPIGSTVPAILKEVADANGQFMTVQAERLALEARITNIDARKKSASTTDELASPIVQRLRDQEAQLKQQYAELQVRLDDKHPAIRDIESQITEIQRSIQAEIVAIRESLRNELRVVSEKERLMRSNLEA